MCGVMPVIAGVMGFLQYRQQQEAAGNQASMYRAQAEAAEQNARVENRKQEQIADQYAQQAEKLRARQRIAAGRASASAGAAGIASGSGSVLDILSSSEDAYREDQANLLNNQRNDNYASRVNQSNYLNQAGSYRASAKSVERQAKWNGISTILGTAASIVTGQSFGGGQSAPAASPSFGTMTTQAAPSAAWSYNTATGAGSAVNTSRYGMNGYLRNRWRF